MNTFIAMTVLGLFSLGFQSFAQEAPLDKPVDQEIVEDNSKVELEARLAQIEQSIMELAKEQGSKTANLEKESKKLGCQIGHLNDFHIGPRTFEGSNSTLTTAKDIKTGSDVIQVIVQRDFENPIKDALIAGNTDIVQKNQKAMQDYKEEAKKVQEQAPVITKESLDAQRLENFKEYEARKQQITKQQLEINQLDV